MVRFNDKPQITTAELTGTDILPITDIEDNVSDKKVSISQLNTYFGDNITTFATKDLANTGMLADAIISAPNGVIVAGSGNTSIIVKNGLQILFSNGRTSDKRFNTTSYTVSSDISQNIATLADDTYELFINNSGTIIYTPLDNVYVSRNTPTVTTTVAYWYDVISNYWKYTSNTGSTWSNVTINALGQFTVASGVLTNVTSNTVAYIPNPEAIMVRDLSNITDTGKDSIKSIVSAPTKVSDLTDDTATNPIDKADTLTGLTATVTELNYCDGVTSNIQTQCDNKLNKQQITNCILEDPQSINLTLSSGTLTLKAGSVVCVPNGFESDGTTPKFDEIEIASDLTLSYSGSTSSNPALVFYNATTSVLYLEYTGNCTSGTTAPSTSDASWYDTTNNLLKKWSSSVLTSSKVSLPVCAITFGTSIGGGNIQLNQTFQSIGYIGSTVFVRKGLKVLIPNGRNDDGSLKNIEYTTSSVVTLNVSGGSGSIPYVQLLYNEQDIGSARFLGEFESLPATVSDAYSWYAFSITDNCYYYTSGSTTASWSKRTGAKVSTCNIASTVISNFKPYQAVNILKYSDSSQISGWSMPSNRYTDLTLGASGTSYTAPANGWFCLQKVTGGTNQYLRFMRSSAPSRLIQYPASSITASDMFPVLKGDTVSISYTVSGATNYFRFYYAEGEV